MADTAVKIPFQEASAPATPASTKVVIYAKSDGLMYSKDDAGTETLMSGGSAGIAELDYVEITSAVVPTATSEATANTIVTANPIAFSGSTVVMIEFFSPDVRPANDAAARYISLWLYDGSSSIGQIGFIRGAASGNNESIAHCSRRLTPSAATHTYSIRASVTSGGSNANVDAGTGGSGQSMPAYIRITRV